MARVDGDKLGSIIGKTVAFGFVMLFIYGIYHDVIGSKKDYLSEKEKAVIDMNSAGVSLSDDEFFSLLEKTFCKVYVESTCNAKKLADGKYDINIAGDITRYWKDNFDTMNLGEIAQQHSTDQFLRLTQMSWKRLRQIEQIRIKYHSQDSSGRVADYNVELSPQSLLTSSRSGEWKASEERTMSLLRDYVLANRHISVDTATGKQWRVVRR